AQTRKARRQSLGGAFAPADRAPGALGQAQGEGLDRDGPVLGVPAGARRRGPTARPPLRRQRLRAGRPHRGARQNAGDIRQSQGADVLAQARVIAITRIQQHHPARNTGRQGGADLLQCDLRLGLKADLFGNARLTPPHGIPRPLLRQIQAKRSPAKAPGEWRWGAGAHAAWQLSLCLSWSQYCRATPTECRPFFGKAVSSMIQASIAPWRSIAGNTISLTLARPFSSDHGDWPTKCSSDRSEERRVG